MPPCPGKHNTNSNYNPRTDMWSGCIVGKYLAKNLTAKVDTDVIFPVPITSQLNMGFFILIFISKWPL